MITGDNIDTAKAIGKEVGLINSNEDIILTSSEFNKKTVNLIYKHNSKLPYPLTFPPISLYFFIRIFSSGLSKLGSSTHS